MKTSEQIKLSLYTLEAEVKRLREEIDDWNDERGRVLNEDCPPDEAHCTCVPHLRAEVARLREALIPFAHFGRCFEAKPLNGLADTVYAIHLGTEWAAEFRVSDCRAARAALGEEGK